MCQSLSTVNLGWCRCGEATGKGGDWDECPLVTMASARQASIEAEAALRR